MAKRPKSNVEKSSTGSKKKKKGAPVSRRTRYMALEPRVVFDGALGADLVDQALSEPGSAVADSVGDALGDLGTCWSVEIDKWQAVMCAGKRRELIADGLEGYRWEIHAVEIVAEGNGV